MGSELTPKYVAALRRLTDRQKLEAAFALYRTARQVKAAGLRWAHPDWPEDRVQREVREIFLRASLQSVSPLNQNEERGLPSEWARALGPTVS